MRGGDLLFQYQGQPRKVINIMSDIDEAWRQGHILHHNDAVSLGLIKQDDTSLKVVVITHDCDLQSTSEQNVEFIVGELVKESSNNTGAKHPRTLHLCYENLKNNDLNAIQLRHQNKHQINKTRFAGVKNDEDFKLSVEEKQILKQWLAAKYGRPAFPDNFEKRLRSYDNKKIRFEKELAKIISKYSTYLIGIFFDLGEDRFSDLDEETPYVLQIVLVYDIQKHGMDARKNAEHAEREITELFIKYFGNPSDSELIALESCVSVPDTEFSLYALRRMDQWRVEYITLQDKDADMDSFIPTTV